MNTSQLRQWLAAGKTERVLDELLPATADADTDLHHEATLLSARFENLTRQKRLGTLEFEDEARELAQINHALLDIINEMDRTSRQGGIPSWAKAAATVLLVLGLLGGIGYAAGWFGADKDLTATNTEQTTPRDTPATQSQLPTQTESTPPKPDPEPAQPKVKPRSSGATTTQRKTSPAAPPVTVPPKQPATQPAKSEPKITEPESGLRALPPEGEALTVNCKTNKGRLGIYYKAGQAIRFYVTANQPCYVRAIYQLADKRLVLLADNRQLTAAEADQWLEIGPGYEAAEPFGEQRVYVFAQTTPFQALTTRTASDGTIFISENLNEALSITRKNKRRQLFAEQDVMLKTTL